MVTADIWPALDYSRVPYSSITTRRSTRRSRSASFVVRRGTSWRSISKSRTRGDYRATYVGETPVIVNRDENGEVHAFINRCAHRGALVRREISGQRHKPCLHLSPVVPRPAGRATTAIPFRRGIRGGAGWGRISIWASTGCGGSRSARSTARSFGTLPFRGRRGPRRLSRPGRRRTVEPVLRQEDDGAWLQPAADPRQLENLRREHPRRRLSREPLT